MRNYRYRKDNKRTMRHVLIVSGLVVLVLCVGAGVFALTNSLFPRVSKNTMGKPEQSSPGSSTAFSAPSSAASTGSNTSSAQASSRAAQASSAATSSGAVVSSAQGTTNSADFKSMYPSLFVDKVKPVPEDDSKVVYLTFDDGPSKLTMPLLDVLDKYKVKATFFVIGKTDEQSVKDMKEIVNRGHAIGVHSYTHVYTQVYQSPASFLTDFAKMHDLILNATGVDTHIYRFPGGSVNSYNRKIAKTITTEMNRRGYVYFDWNVSSGDAQGGASAESIYNETIKGVHGHRQSVILFHNTNAKQNTLSQIPKIIETLQKEGYRFATLDPSVDNKPYIFRVPS